MKYTEEQIKAIYNSVKSRLLYYKRLIKYQERGIGSRGVLPLMTLERYQKKENEFINLLNELKNIQSIHKYRNEHVEELENIYEALNYKCDTSKNKKLEVYLEIRNIFDEYEMC